MTSWTFREPDLESMKISVAGKELDPEQYKAEIEWNTLEKEHKSHDRMATLTMTIGTRGPLG